MIEYNKNFGYQIYGNTMGEVWLDLIECVTKNGELEFDEKRGRFAIQNIRLKIEKQNVDDSLFELYANKENIDKIISLTFEDPTMVDMDITPSFRDGAKSYYARIVEGRLIDFVVKRLTEIPESKKAVIVFPTHEDYTKIINSPYNDYLPCVVSIQFRMRKNDLGGYTINTIFNMRSMDAFQKCPGNMTIFAMITKKIAGQLSINLGTDVIPGFMEGLITDAHIYQNTLKEAQSICMKNLNSKYVEKLSKTHSKYDFEFENNVFRDVERIH